MEVGKQLRRKQCLSARKVDEFWQEKKSEELEVDDKDGFTLGPLLSLKEQLDKDKDGESLRRWKEKLLGCLERVNKGNLKSSFIPLELFLMNLWKSILHCL